jgi:uncharacterized protein YjbI with pentapeptide repeats
VANSEHIEILRQGVEAWNRWRDDNPELKPDLSDTDLSSWDLCDIDLSHSNLSKVNFSDANLMGAILICANLSDADIDNAELSGVSFCDADLSGVDLIEVNFSYADLSGVDLTGNLDLLEIGRYNINFHGVILSGLDFSDPEIDLDGVDLSYADLSDTNFYRKDLSDLNLRGADLSYAYLCQAQALGTDFTNTILTGACIEDWNINSDTKFDGVICEYIYLKSPQRERRPRDGVFKPGEFSALFQQVIETVDLIFTDGIDWQAFFTSFQELRSQYADQSLSIQAIEKKQGEAFIVRLEVPAAIDKAAIESRAKDLYEKQLRLFEIQYEKRLRLQHVSLEDARRTIKTERQEKTKLMGVIEIMASNQGPKYDFRGAQFAGNFAETVQGDQIGGTINNYGASLADIMRLLTTLRDQAQAFPPEHKDEALDVLNDLEADVKQAEPDQNRISRRLKRLVAIGATVGAIASGAATFSGNLNDFTSNITELTETLGIPIELVQPDQLPSSGTP